MPLLYLGRVREAAHARLHVPIFMPIHVLPVSVRTCTVWENLPLEQSFVNSGFARSEALY